MSGAVYSNPAARIGKLKGDIIKHAEPVEVLGITGVQKPMPKHQSDTIVFRRWLPYGGSTSSADTINRWVVSANAHLVSEGVTPAADTLVPQDITVQIYQYGCLYQVTNKVVDLYEDDMPAAMKKQVGERLGLVRELVRYGALKACTNAYYSGGTSRSTVSAPISLNILRQGTRDLRANHAKQITGILAAGPDINTTPVEAAYLVFVHTDAEQDIRDLPGFVHVSQYANRKVVSPEELGSVERFRFITSPELASYQNAGAAVGSTGCYSTGGSDIDVYPFIIVGEDAWGQLSLRGLDNVDPTWIMPGQKDKNDPLGQRGFIGGTCWAASVILNQGWMEVIEAGVSAL